jgi:hypothetical protein
MIESRGFGVATREAYRVYAAPQVRGDTLPDVIFDESYDF